jgi:hypothetical protein
LYEVLGFRARAEDAEPDAGDGRSMAPKRLFEGQPPVCSRVEVHDAVQGGALLGSLPHAWIQANEAWSWTGSHLELGGRSFADRLRK